MASTARQAFVCGGLASCALWTERSIPTQTQVLKRCFTRGRASRTKPGSWSSSPFSWGILSFLTRGDESKPPADGKPPERFLPSENIRRRTMAYFFSPSKLIHTLALLQRINSSKSELHIASSLAFLSKDRAAALQMGSLGTFEALWVLSHSARSSEAEPDASDEQLMIHHLVNTMENLVTQVPRWSLLVKDSLALLHLVRIWATVPDYKDETGLALLRILLAVATAKQDHEPHASAFVDHAASVPGASSLLNSALFQQIRHQMAETQAVLTGPSRFDGLRLLLESLLAVHYHLVLNANQNELFAQALELELDVLLALTVELRRLTENDPPDVADLFEEHFIRETFRIIRDTFQPSVEAMQTAAAKVKVAQILSLLAADELGRFEISQPQSGWIHILSSWTRSADPQLRLHTAHALAHLMENDQIGTHIIQQFGFELITSLADIPDLDVQNTVTRMFGRLRSISAAEFDSLSGCVKDFTIDENWMVIESNAASRVSQAN